MPLTRAFWRLLANPPYEHPLFRRVVAPRVPPEWLRSISPFSRPATPLLYLMLGAFACLSVASGSPALWLLLAAGAVLVVNGTFYGLGWTLGIAGEWASQRERGTESLLYLLPGGAFIALLALSTGIMYRENAFRQQAERHRSLLVTTGIVLVVLGLAAFLNRRAPEGSTLVTLLTIGGALFAADADFKQSLVLSALVGIWAGEHTVRRLDAELGSVLLMLTLQLVLYGLAAALAFWLLPPLLDSLIQSDWLRGVLLLALRIAGLLLPREFIIIIFWRALSERLNLPSLPTEATAKQ